MSRHTYLRTQVEGSVAIATLHHPPANTWLRDALAELEDLVADLESQPAVRSLIFTGAGGKFFSAGADIQQFRDASPDDALALAKAFHSAFGCLADFRGVTFAAINGFALGGGLECALACDFRIAEEHARLGLPETRVGVLPGGGGTQRLPLLVGEAWAKRLILLGDQLDARTAERIGLVHEVVSVGTAADLAMVWARKVEGASPDAIAACKRLVERRRERFLGACFADERHEFAKLFGTADQREGVTGFLEKRQPVWTEPSCSNPALH